MNIDDALVAYRTGLVAAAGRWQARRERRRRRLLLVSSAFALAGVVVGTAVAAGGWLVGSPAPRNVKSDFGSYATQLGFNPRPGKAVLVASDGPYELYATTDKQGGYCTLVSAPWKRPGPHGEGGDCNSRRQAAVPFSVGLGGAAGAPDHGTLLIVVGRTRDAAAARVRFDYPASKIATARIGKSGFFITSISIDRPIFTGLFPGAICRWTSTFVLLDAKGKQLGRNRVPFGPPVCERRPTPVVSHQDGRTVITIRVNQTGYVRGARPHDRIACRAGRREVAVTVPRRAVRVFTRHAFTPERRLALQIQHLRDGRVWAICDWE